MTVLPILSTVAALAAAATSFLLGCQSWEHRRRTRRHLRERRRDGFAPPTAVGPPLRVALIAPCKGLEVGLRENLGALFELAYGNYQIIFVTESSDDPARPVVESLIRAHPQRQAKLVTARVAAYGCQKVHNLLAAVAAADADVEAYAFVDSDARPRFDWLANLVARLGEPGVGACTGYRWFVPLRRSLAGAVLYSINATAASLYTPKSFQPVWGGAWAMRRDVYDAIQLERQWEGRLTDDLVATTAVLAAGLRVEFEPSSMIVSPLDTDWTTTFAFLRRQYAIGRLYARPWWALTLAATTVTALGFWGALAAAVAGAVGGASWWRAPALACAAWYAVNAARASIRRDLANQYVPGTTGELGAAARLDAWITPLAALVNWAAIVTTIASRRMVWRSVEYEILPGGRARVVRRVDALDADRLDPSAELPFASLTDIGQFQPAHESAPAARAA